MSEVHKVLTDIVTVRVKYGPPPYTPSLDDRAVYLQFTLWYDCTRPLLARIKRFLKRRR